MRHPRLWLVGLTFVLALIMVVGILILVGRGGSAKHSQQHPDYPYNVQMLADQGRQHFPPGEVYSNYNSNPPTSGPHSSVPAPWGVSDDPVPKEAAVHNMEHGGVIVWYNCDGGPKPLTADQCRQLRDQLAGIVQPGLDDGVFILMTPYSQMEHRIALTAWTYLDVFDEFDDARIRHFIASFECRFNVEHFCA